MGTGGTGDAYEPVVEGLAAGLVQGRWDISQDYVKETYERATEAFENLLAYDFIAGGLGEYLQTHIQNALAKVTMPYEKQTNVLKEVELPDEPDDVTIKDQKVTDPDVTTWTNWEYAYTSDLLTEVKIKFLNALEQGGTALSPDMEEAIFNRTKHKLDELFEKDVNNLNEQIEAVGWKIPSGHYEVRVDRINREKLRELAKLDFEIATNNATLTQENILRTRDAASTLSNYIMSHEVEKEKNFIETFTAKMERVKTVIAKDLGIAQINSVITESRIKKYLAQIERIKVMYEAINNGLVAEIEQEKAKVTADWQYASALLESASTLFGIEKEVIRAVASVASQISAAALGSISASGQIGYSENRSDSTSANASSAISEQTGTSVSIINEWIHQD